MPAGGLTPPAAGPRAANNALVGASLFLHDEEHASLLGLAEALVSGPGQESVGFKGRGQAFSLVPCFQAVLVSPTGAGAGA